ncbi:TIGR01906 family membrane protein [Arthrobacter sp. JSM 101049]|uniref:TIGR01906 family membrane protein n=1 Tax=Arthrobacter sp. JSM 101049 TaxID=929097 RepID=UPI0035624DDF
MENKNAVPDGDERAGGPSPRPASRVPDAELPEFLKGPDPEDPEPAHPESGTAGGEAASADATESAGSDGSAAASETSGEAAMGRDDWESAFADASDAEPDDVPAGTARADAAREDSSREDGTPVAAAVAADHDASHTQALPAWDQKDSGTRAMPTTPDAGADDRKAAAPADGVGDREADGGPADEPAAAGDHDTTAATGEGAAAAAGTAGPDTGTADETQRTDAVAAAKRRGGTPRQPAADADPEAQRRHEAREAALTAKPMFARVVQTLLAIAFPFMLVIAAIRVVASPWFLWLEYHRPGFPADMYGFSPDERLTYGNYGVDYINNSAPSAYLGNLMDANGNPLFLATEVSHMADVKAVVGASYAAGAILFVLAVMVCLYLGRRYAGGMRRAFFAGSVATLVVMIVLTVLAVLNFQTFFTDFHELFFSQGNWTFHANDTLIRLYPTQFWIDAGIVIAALVLVTSLVFLITTWPTRRRRERSRLLQVNRDLGLD